MIAFHDGVWDESSTGRGPVAASQKTDLEKILLRTRDGKISSERPALLTDILALTKDKIYLEVDFKSSANEAAVIEAIRNYGAADHVILISYSKTQAMRLSRLAPDMMLSVPPSVKMKKQAVWHGSKIAQANIPLSQYAIGKIGPVQYEKQAAAKRQTANILVTDYANQYRPITGLTRKNKTAYQACLAGVKLRD
jgi:glycerophosphoryl diester phosphodiesterase